MCVFCMWIGLFLTFPLKPGILLAFSLNSIWFCVPFVHRGSFHVHESFHHSSPELGSQGSYQQLMSRWLLTDFEASVFVLWYREQHDA